MKCLLIQQNEEQRYKVILGRNIHKIKAKINKEYLRKKLGAKEKIIDAYLSSGKKEKRKRIIKSKINLINSNIINYNKFAVS